MKNISKVLPKSFSRRGLVYTGSWGSFLFCRCSSVVLFQPWSSMRARFLSVLLGENCTWITHRFYPSSMLTIWVPSGCVCVIFCIAVSLKIMIADAWCISWGVNRSASPSGVKLFPNHKTEWFQIPLEICFSAQTETRARLLTGLLYLLQVPMLWRNG